MLLWIAIAVISVVALLACLFAWINRMQVRKLQLQLEQLEAKLQSELTPLNNGVIGIGQRVISVEKKLNSLGSTQTSVVDSEDQPFSQAASLLDKGMDAGQLAERCGLSEAEAQLIALLKQKPQDPH